MESLFRTWPLPAGDCPQGTRLGAALRPQISFQPTPPPGGDGGGAKPKRGRSRVSIHAPAWGATPKSPRSRTQSSCFNPRPRVGGDENVPLGRRERMRFQSTPPRGGRRRLRSQPSPASRFNPRPRVGGDSSSLWSSKSGGKRFNPRPRVGGDKGYFIKRGDVVLFQSTPPRGGRLGSPRILWRLYRRFNPRPPRGGRPARRMPSSPTTRFNPRPPRGGRHEPILPAAV